MLVIPADGKKRLCKSFMSSYPPIKTMQRQKALSWEDNGAHLYAIFSMMHDLIPYAENEDDHPYAAFEKKDTKCETNR